MKNGKGKLRGDPIVGGMSENEGKYWGSGEFANMPKETRMKAYPKASQFGPTVLDDTMGHVDVTNEDAHDTSRRFISNQH